VTKKRLINGQEITDVQIEAWADEVSQGLDIETIKKRGRGRPGRTAEASQVVSLRFSASELEAIDARAEREHISRSQAIREAVLAYSA
jgi:hypothetical protein